MGIPDHLTHLLRNLCAGQEMRVRTGHGITGWFQIGKALFKTVYCHPAYLTYMQSISCRSPWLIPGLGRFPGEGKGSPLQYSGLENSIDGIVCGAAESQMTEQLSLSLFTFHHGKCWARRSKSWNQDAERNIKYLRYTDDTIQRTESKEKLRSLLMKLKEASEKLASTQV